eukprot:SAG11_NODE_26826_length_340_cov_0.858921_1_plen_39_part_01
MDAGALSLTLTANISRLSSTAAAAAAIWVAAAVWLVSWG